MSDVIRSVEQIAEQAYEFLSKSENVLRSEVHGHRLCLGFSGFMYRAVIAAQTFSRVGFIQRPVPSSRPLTHTYLIGTGYDETKTVIDGTWQQFLEPEQRRAELPKVAIGTRDEVMALTQEAGVAVRDSSIIWGPHNLQVVEEVILSIAAR